MELYEILLVVFLDIKNVDPNIWVLNQASLDVKNKFFHLSDADFIFNLLKDQPNAFSNFQEFLKDSEKIWTDEKDCETIQKKIIKLVRPENE